MKARAALYLLLAITSAVVSLVVFAWRTADSTAPIRDITPQTVAPAVTYQPESIDDGRPEG